MNLRASNTPRTRYEKKENPRVHLFAYSWNKAEDLENTLRSLAKSNYPYYKVFVLNNGSTDATMQNLHKIKHEKLFNEFEIIDLPINIGAPAARNWLAALPENHHADFLCYLDDDIILPSMWIEEMIATFENFPDAGVVGAKILFNDPIKRIQHTGGIITKEEDWLHSFEAYSYHEDKGQHNYIAERHYTMGCCHMYRREVFEVVGDYDLKFAPTQFDEVEHQIRMRLFGYKAIYNGFIEVHHLLKTGSNPSPIAQTSREANRLKMLPMFTKEEIHYLVSESLLTKQPLANRPLISDSQNSLNVNIANLTSLSFNMNSQFR